MTAVRRALAYWIGGAALFLLASASLASAKPAECLLEVRSTAYINGRCEWVPEKDGSFTMSAGAYFATLLVDAPGVGQGYWNEDPKGTHAHASLGEMRRDQACWVNATARICAWKPGERASAGQ